MMRKLFCIGIFISFIPLVGNTQVRTVVAGHFVQSIEDELRINLILWSDKNLAQRTIEHSVISKSGHFMFEFFISGIEEITVGIGDDYMLRNFQGGNATILIEPGDSLYVTIPGLDRCSISDVSFSGVGFEKQQLLKDITRKCATLKTTGSFNGTAEDLRKSISFNQSLKKLVMSELTTPTLKVSGLARESLQSKLLSLIYLSSTELFFLMDLTSDEVRNVYAFYKDGFKIEEDLLLQNEQIIGGLIWTISLKNEAILKYLMRNNLPYSIVGTDKLSRVRQYEILHSAYKDLPIKERLLAGYLIMYALNWGWNDELEISSEKYFSDVEVDNYYRSQLEDVRSKLTTTRIPAYNFALQDTAGNVVHLDQFIGKVVLLDFMFKGCVGCAFVAPKLGEIEHELKGSDVVFISISVDRTKDMFKKGIKDFMSPGSLPLYTNGLGTGHEIIKHYSIVAYPSLILIDKKGMVITSRAPNPCTEDGKKELIELLRKEL